MSTIENDAKPDSEYQNELTPPLDVTYFSLKRITLAENKIVTTELSPISYSYTITWRVDQYTYAINGDPYDPSFGSRGGEIYVILVHSGTITNRGSGDLPTFVFEVIPDKEDIKPIFHLPQAEADVVDDNYIYKLSYSETLQMLKNRGSEMTSFPALYKETYLLNDVKQYSQERYDRLGFALEPGSVSFRQIGIHALTLIRAPSLSCFPSTFTFDQGFANLLVRQSGVYEHIPIEHGFDEGEEGGGEEPEQPKADASASA